MATLTTEKPVEIQKEVSDGSSATLQPLEAEAPERVERRYGQAVSTIREPGIITIQTAQALSETKAGFLTRMIGGLRDAAFQVRIAGPGGGHFRNSHAVTLEEKTEFDAIMMGWFHW